MDGEIQALFHCHVRILAFHCFVKDASPAVFVLYGSVLLEISNPGGMKPKYKFGSQKSYIFPHICFDDICGNGGMGLLIL